MSPLLTLLLLGCAHPLSPTANAEDEAWPERPELDAQVLEQMRRSELAAVSVCTIEQGELQWCQGYGWADVAQRRPALVQTPYLLASVSKAFNASLILRYVESGELDLQAPVALDAPWPGRAPSLLELLTHSAGIQDDLDTFLAHTGPQVEPDLAAYVLEDLAREGALPEQPGERWAYSSLGPAAAALVLEQRMGQPWQELAAPFFAELGVVAMHPDQVPDAALLYPDTRSWEPGELVSSDALPAGFLYADAPTVASLAVDWLSGGQGYDSELMLSPATEVDDFRFTPYTGQGVGLMRFVDMGERELWGHAGGYYGLSTLVLVDPERDQGVVVLATGGPETEFGRWRASWKVAEQLFQGMDN